MGENRESRVVKPGRNAWREVAVDDSSVLVDAENYYRAFYAAAERAERHILISGWQFNRGVPLLRGTYAVGRDKIELVDFLDSLCARNPRLHIYILAWDFHMVFALEREWMQRLYFHYATNERLVFRFDDAVADQGSHHQKFAVIDGEEAFVGGIDLCESRWDDRGHRTVNPLRLSRGKPDKPYHDVQAHFFGREMGESLVALFRERWARCSGDPITLPEGERQRPWPDPPPAAPVPSIRLGPARVALSRTDPTSADGTVTEVESLLCDAVASARRLIYIETQYFSSTRVREALVAHMRQAPSGSLDIVVVVNERAEAFKEELAVGLRQAQNLEILRAVAAETGHALGLYHSMSDGPSEPGHDGIEQRPTYIHSKLLVVDDRFLSLGSANLTNRSMGRDSELNASWEDAPGSAVARGIRRLRVSLLAEHAGLAGVRAVRSLCAPAGLVARLDAIAATPGARLLRHGPPSEGQQAAMALVNPETLPLDPGRPEPDEIGCPPKEAGKGAAP